MSSVISIILHFDEYLGKIIQNYGSLTYFILFAIIFLETGLVITPFLPGDSLLFVVGALSAQGSLQVLVAFMLLALAAILGDSLNYSIGAYFGRNVFYKSRFFKKEYLERTEAFYQ